MRPYAAQLAQTKWYHVVWATHRRRPWFKIPATARFCERVMRQTCSAAGLRLDTVSVTADRVQLLVQAPAALPRSALVQALKDAGAVAVRRAGAAPPGARRLWDDTSWCAALRTPEAIAAVRHHLTRLNSLGAPVAATPVRQ